MTLTLDWERRIRHWAETMAELFYEPLGTVPLEAHLTYDQLTVDEAASKAFEPVPPGTPWGAKWQYGWFRTMVTLPDDVCGERIVCRSGAGSECAIYVDGRAAGAWDQHHRELTLTRKGVPGTRYAIMHCRCKLTTILPVTRAQLTNMLEEEGTDLACTEGHIPLEFRPFEIKTLRLPKSGQERTLSI